MRDQAFSPRRFLPALLAAAVLAAGSPAFAQNELEVRGLDRLDFRQIVRDAKEKVFPTVVFIRVLRENLEGGKKVSQEVSGSGVVISADGEVLSNWHVVDKAVEVRCQLQDGTACAAETIGADKDTDISLLKLKLPEGKGPLPYAKLGKSVDLTEGDFVMAMGAPWGMSRSVSIGIISCTKRFLPGTSEYSYWLQTDAAISPDNSGGPLVNTAGEVVGINTRGIMQGGDTGFSVPIEVVKQVADRMREKGRVDWSWTGLQLQPLKDFNRNIYFDASNGVMIADTDPGSPARHAGILAGDRLISINGNRVTAMTDEDLPVIRRELAFLPKTEPSTLELIRKGENMTLKFTAKDKGQVEGEELDCPRWDFTVKAINQFDNPDLHYVRSKGVFIFGVKYPGNAANVLQQRDILVKIGNRDVETLDDVKAAHKEAMDTLGTKDRVLVSVLRNGQLRQVVLDYARNYEKE